MNHDLAFKAFRLRSLASYNAAVTAIGERVKAGAPVPEFMQSRKVAK